MHVRAQKELGVCTRWASSDRREHVQHTGAGAAGDHRSAAAAGPSPGAPRAAAAPERQLVGWDRGQLRRCRTNAAERPDRRDANGKAMRLWHQLQDHRSSKPAHSELGFSQIS